MTLLERTGAARQGVLKDHAVVKLTAAMLLGSLLGARHFFDAVRRWRCLLAARCDLMLLVDGTDRHLLRVGTCAEIARLHGHFVAERVLVEIRAPVGGLGVYLSPHLLM